MTNDDEKVMLMTYGIKKSNAHTSDAFLRVKLVCVMVVVVIAHNVLLDFYWNLHDIPTSHKNLINW